MKLKIGKFSVNIWLLLLFATMVGVIIWLLVKLLTKTPVIEEKKTEAVIEPPKAKVKDWTNCNDNFPLQKGSCGPRVSQLQHMLKFVDKQDLGPTGIDGKFWDYTEAALLKSRNRDNISQDFYTKLGMEKYPTYQTK